MLPAWLSLKTAWNRQHLQSFNLLPLSIGTQPLADYKSMDCCRLRKVTSVVSLSVTNVLIKISCLYVVLVFKMMLNHDWVLFVRCKIFQRCSFVCLQLCNKYTYTSTNKPYFLPPWSRVLLEKLTGFELVNKFLSFYGTWKFITTLARASPCHYTGGREVIKLLHKHINSEYEVMNYHTS